MSQPANISENRQPVSAGYRRLTGWGLVLTFLLVVLGGIVRVSDSGLGCGPGGSGLHGWPLCDGGLVPGETGAILIEYSHRTLASVVGIVMILLAWFAWRNYRPDKRIVFLSSAATGLVIAEGLLGGLTVEYDLNPVLVATHLGIAMLVTGLLMTLWFICRDPNTRPVASRGTRWLGAAALALTWCTIVAGGYVAGTEKFGSTSAKVAGGAHYACGTEFPACKGEILIIPLGNDHAVNVHLTHRLLMYLTLIFALILVFKAWKTGGRARRFAPVVVFVLLGQILLGAINVWVLEDRSLILAHLTGGTLLWLSVTWLSLVTLLSEDTSEPSPGSGP
jgi:heme A synthase